MTGAIFLFKNNEIDQCGSITKCITYNGFDNDGQKYFLSKLNENCFTCQKYDLFIPATTKRNCSFFVFAPLAF